MVYALISLLLILLVTLAALAVVRSNRSSAAVLESAFVQQQEALRKEIETLREELRAKTAAEQVAVPQPERAKISEDHLMILGAVLACHFGKRVKVRGARVISVGSGSNVWSQQGRAAVQASHSNRY